MTYFVRTNQEFKYKGVEDRAAAPLEICHHSRAHKTVQRRSQRSLAGYNYSQNAVGFLALFAELTK